MAKEYVISIAKANLIALIMVLPISVLLGVPFVLLYGVGAISLKSILTLSAIYNLMLFIIAVTVGGVIHEILHALGWVIFTKKGWKAISFGIKWEYFTPYCHCNEALKRNKFLVGAILPLIILGLLPVIWSYYNGSFVVWFYGFFFTIAAGGDIIAIWMLRKVKKDQLVLDHPTELGFTVL